MVRNIYLNDIAFWIQLGITIEFNENGAEKRRELLYWLCFLCRNRRLIDTIESVTDIYTRNSSRR